MPLVSLQSEALFANEFSAMIALAVGLAYCLFGYPVLRLMVGLTGFVAAGAVAGALANIFSDGQAMVVGGAALVGGICGAFALFFLYRLGIFIIGVAGAFLLARAILEGGAAPWTPWAILGSSVLGGVVALLLERPILIFATAVIGAWASVHAGLFLWTHEANPAYASIGGMGFPAEWIRLGGWALFSLLGLIVQFHLSSKHHERR